MVVIVVELPGRRFFDQLGDPWDGTGDPKALAAGFQGRVHV
jgi:hypothetical protein